MPLTSRLDSPEIYQAIRRWRATFFSRSEIVAKLKDEHGVTISVSGLDQWLRARAAGKRRKLRHELPPLDIEPTQPALSPATAMQTPTKTTTLLDEVAAAAAEKPEHIASASLFGSPITQKL